MNIKRNILTIMTVLAFVSANAKIATWSISPNYQELKRYYGDMYLYQNNGKWGIITLGDNVLLKANYDFITPFVNGYALIGSKEGSKLLLECILGEDGNINFLNDKFYLPSNYQYVSEDKLVVSNKNGKFGYINTSGDIVVKCQFDNALPFKEGYAPVKQGNYMKFITENYDRNASRNMLVVDFHYGEMTAAGCFSNGLAPIAYNTDYALINANGQKVKKIKEAEFKQTYKANNAAPSSKSVGFTTASNYIEYSENGKYGLKQGDNIIVTPQFDSFREKYSDGYVLTSLNGKQGLLKINDGDISIKTNVKGITTSELQADKKGIIQPITFDCSVPINLNNYRILLNAGNGQLIDKTSEFSRNGNTYTFTSSPIVAQGADECQTHIVIENDGIILADLQKNFKIIYPIKLRLVPSKPFEVRADEKDYAKAEVFTVIHNDSNKPVTVNIIWSTGKQESLTIPARSSKKSVISVSQSNVETTIKKTYTMTVDNGDKTSTYVTYIPYW